LFGKCRDVVFERELRDQSRRPRRICGEFVVDVWHAFAIVVWINIVGDAITVGVWWRGRGRSGRCGRGACVVLVVLGVAKTEIGDLGDVLVATATWPDSRSIGSRVLFTL